MLARERYWERHYGNGALDLKIADKEVDPFGRKVYSMIS